MSIGFDRSRDRLQRELSINKNQKGIYHVIIMLKDVFGFAEHHENSTYGLGFELKLTINTDNSVLNKDNAINNAKIKNIALERYVPQYTPSKSNQGMLSEQILSKTTTELQQKERSVFMKDVHTQNLWSFELGTQEGKNIPIWSFVVFQQTDRQD